MVYRKKTLEEQNPAPVEQELVSQTEKQYPVKKLVVDADTLLYKIDGTNVDVHIFLDVGMKYQDKDKIWHQIPEVKMSVERDYKRLAGLRVDQMMELMKAGYRPTKKWTSSFQEDKTGKNYIPNRFDEAVDIMEKYFNENHAVVFEFKVDLDLLKRSNIADIFTRVVQGRQTVDSLKTW